MDLKDYEPFLLGVKSYYLGEEDDMNRDETLMEVITSYFRPEE